MPVKHERSANPEAFDALLKARARMLSAETFLRLGEDKVSRGANEYVEPEDVRILMAAVEAARDRLSEAHGFMKEACERLGITFVDCIR